MEITGLILKSAYLLVPAFAANMAPVIFRSKFKFLAIPLDFGYVINKKPLLGKNKTVRGLVMGLIFSVFFAFLQKLALRMPFFREISVLDYSGWLYIGFLLGFGAIAGDAIESFFKRRFGIHPGKPWIPFDQTDFVIGSLFCISFYQILGSRIYLTAIICSFFLHIIVNHFAFYTGIRKEKW